MDAYITFLLVVHIVGAIVGIGPTYAFGFIGARAGKSSPEAALALTETMHMIEWRLVTPVALITQPLSGILLIFETGRNVGFWQREWLVMAIVIYAVLLGLSYTAGNNASKNMIRLMRAGEGGSAEMARHVKTARTLGPLFGVMGIVIAILMVWKPGE